MQPLNFTQHSSKKHKAVRTWFLINCLLLITLLAICTFFTVQQYNQYKKLKPLASTHPQMQKITKKAASKNEPTKILKTVQSKLNANTHLESFALTDSHIEFKIAGNTIKAISTITQQLQTIDTKIQLTGLQNCNKKIIGIFTYQNTL
jgi:hypothetical protein